MIRKKRHRSQDSGIKEMLYTKQCVVCGKIAKSWTGFVITRRKYRRILAGWCEHHNPFSDSWTGFVGHYQDWMGKRSGA